MKHLTTKFQLIFLFLLCLSHTSLAGPPSIGIEWNASQSTQIDLDANRIIESGIKWVVVTGLLPEEMLTRFENNSVALIVHSGLIYPTASTIRYDSLAISEQTTDPVYYYGRRQVHGFILAGFPQNHPLVHRWLDRISRMFPFPFAVVRATGSSDLFTVDWISGKSEHPFSRILIYRPESFDLAAFQSLHQNAVSQTELLVLPFALLHDTSAAPVLEAFINDPDALFSIPRAPDQTPPANWPVFILMGVWGIFLLALFSSHNYRKAVQRYFLTHTFYVNDVYYRRTRSTSSPVFFLLNTAVMGGLFAMITTSVYLSPIGKDVFMHHYTAANLILFSPFTVFLTGFTFTLGFNLFISIWLYLGASLQHFSGQAITLATWTQHVLMVLLVPLVIFTTNTYSGSAASVLFIAYGVVWFWSFPQSVIDLGSFQQKKRLFFFIYTVLVYLVLAGLSVYYSVDSGFWDVLQLALSLR